MKVEFVFDIVILGYAIVQAQSEHTLLVACAK